jgi:DNA-binding transcriptional regulator YiaG
MRARDILKIFIPFYKLSKEEIVEIYTDDNLSNEELANCYGISPETVQNIKENIYYTNTTCGLDEPDY